MDSRRLVRSADGSLAWFYCSASPREDSGWNSEATYSHIWVSEESVTSPLHRDWSLGILAPPRRTAKKYSGVPASGVWIDSASSFVGKPASFFGVNWETSEKPTSSGNPPHHLRFLSLPIVSATLFSGLLWGREVKSPSMGEAEGDARPAPPSHAAWQCLYLDHSS